MNWLIRAVNLRPLATLALAALATTLIFMLSFGSFELRSGLTLLVLSPSLATLLFGIVLKRQIQDQWFSSIAAIPAWLGPIAYIYLSIFSDPRDSMFGLVFMIVPVVQLITIPIVWFIAALVRDSIKHSDA